MRDIGRRIQRYRLSRYRPIQGGMPRPPRWAWVLGALWLVYVGVVSERSLYRIWRMGAENARAERELAEARAEIARMEREGRDPKAQLEEAERALRREGFAKRGELIYRIQPGALDTLGR